MDYWWLYYVWASLLVLFNGVAWCLNLFGIPGNWIMVLAAAIFILIFPVSEEPGMSWWFVGAALVLSGLAELVEFVSGAAGAAKKGGSRRGLVLAVVGTMLGSIAGAILLSAVVPVVGTVVGAVGGGASGAFGGTYLGEAWKGRTTEESLNVSKAALIGRLLGTVGKLAIGAIVFVVIAIDAFFDF